MMRVKPMDPVELGVLKACQEFVLRQQEMLPHLAAVLEVPQEQVFYTWALRRAKTRGHLKDTAWSYYPHGFECDLKNSNDGRYLRIDFGPHGRVGILNSWGVLQFIMSSVIPWREFPQLKAFFAKGNPPYDYHSGDSCKMSQVWDRLESKGVFEKADARLVALQAKYTSRGPDGLTYTQFPQEVSEQTQVDCAVAHRQILSPTGTQLLNAALREIGKK
jgi:hypothetical protein